VRTSSRPKCDIIFLLLESAFARITLRMRFLFGIGLKTARSELICALSGREFFHGSKTEKAIDEFKASLIWIPRRVVRLLGFPTDIWAASTKLKVLSGR